MKLKPCAFTVCLPPPSKTHRGAAFHTSDFASNFLIGNAQFGAAREIMESSAPKSVFSSPDATIETANTTALTNVKGSVRSVHVHMNIMKVVRSTLSEQVVGNNPFQDELYVHASCLAGALQACLSCCTGSVPVLFSPLVC